MDGYDLLNEAMREVEDMRKRQRITQIVACTMMAVMLLMIFGIRFWFNTPHLVDDPTRIAELEANLNKEFSEHDAEFHNLLAETVKQKQGVIPEKIVFQFEFYYGRSHASAPSGVKVWYRTYDGSWYQWRVSATEELLDFLAKKTYNLD